VKPYRATKLKDEKEQASRQKQDTEEKDSEGKVDDTDGGASEMIKEENEEVESESEEAEREMAEGDQGHSASDEIDEKPAEEEEEKGMDVEPEKLEDLAMTIESKVDVRPTPLEREPTESSFDEHALKPSEQTVMPEQKPRDAHENQDTDRPKEGDEQPENEEEAAKRYDRETEQRRTILMDYDAYYDRIEQVADFSYFFLFCELLFSLVLSFFIFILFSNCR
jgi:hypothetical protein